MTTKADKNCAKNKYKSVHLSTRGLIIITCSQHMYVDFVCTVHEPDTATDASASASSQSSAAAAAAAAASSSAENSASHTSPSQPLHLLSGNTVDGIPIAVESWKIAASPSNQTENASGMRSSRQLSATSARSSADEQKKKSSEVCCIS